MAWQPGPMPADTWGWGGVATRDSLPGFFFADFCGNYVVVEDGTPDGKRLRPEDVLQYDNSLTLPPGVNHSRLGNGVK